MQDRVMVTEGTALKITFFSHKEEVFEGVYNYLWDLEVEGNHVLSFLAPVLKKICPVVVRTRRH